MLINLDANAGIAPLPEVRAYLANLPEAQLNPSAVHQLGQRARVQVDRARTEVARLVDAPSNLANVVFTSGATESNSSVILGAFGAPGVNAAASRGASLVVSRIEHPSVLEPARRIAALGFSVVEVSVSTSGELNQRELLSSLGPNTRLVSLMLANNETGHILPIAEFVPLIRDRAPQALIHTDAVQAVGKIPVSFRELGVDLLSVSGHKIGALPGVGALIVREGVEFRPLFEGGAQESYRRAGTENVVGIVSFGIASEIARELLPMRMSRLATLSATLRESLRREIEDAVFVSPVTGGLPNTLSLIIPGIAADDLVVALDLEGICVSSGAACSSGKPRPSHVIQALGFDEKSARSAIRISLEPNCSAENIEAAGEAISLCVKRMRSVYL